MDGLTNIIAKITEQNEAECAEILENAEKSAKEILEKARLEAEKEERIIKADSDFKVSVANSKASSGAEIEYKRAVLAEKSELINSCIRNAIDSISESSDEVYFGYIEKLIMSNALMGEGYFVVCEKDKKRLPAGFVDAVNSKLPDGKKIVLSDKTIDEAGFVIEYDEMKVDCTFLSLVDDKLDEIRDSLNKVLFA